MREKKLQKHISKKTAGLLGLGAVLLTFGLTWAYYTGSLELDNPLQTSHSGAAMVEEFNPDNSFLPGETVVKKVAFTNTGEMDLFLRVEVPPEEGWYSEKNEALDSGKYLTSVVAKNWNTAVWPVNEDDPANSDMSETNFWSPVFTDAVTGKQYRYYKQILKPGQQTDHILESITLSPEVSNDRHDLDYSDKIYKLTFNAEAVPVEDHSGKLGVQALWAMSVTADTAGTLTWQQETASSQAGN